MIFDVSKLKISTKSLIAFLIGLGSLLQVPQISSPVMAFGAHHPHVATIIAAITAIIGLLHNPTVERVLGIQQNITAATTTIDGVTTGTITSSTTVPVTTNVIGADGSAHITLLDQTKQGEPK